MNDYALCFDDIDPLAPHKRWTMNFPSEKLRNYVCLHNVQAVFVVSDSVDWGRDIQVVFVSNPLQCLQLSIKFHPTLYLFMAYL